MHTRKPISQSILYIDNHLTKRVTVEQAAAVAGYSRHHFSRTFLALTGLTPNSYLRKRRLSEAARELVNSSRPILMIALDYQFGSQEAFTRSFKQEFGVSPGCYRQNGRLHRLWGRISLAFSNLIYPGQGIDLSPQLLVAYPKDFAATDFRRVATTVPAGPSTRFSGAAHIRYAHRQDIPALCRLYHQLNELTLHDALQQRETLEECEYFDAMAQPLWRHNPIGTQGSSDVSILVAEIDGEVVGLAEILLREGQPHAAFGANRNGFLRSLIVRDHLRGHGIGRDLLEAVKAWLSEHGATELHLELWESEQERYGVCVRPSSRMFRCTQVRML